MKATYHINQDIKNPKFSKYLLRKTNSEKVSNEIK